MNRNLLFVCAVLCSCGYPKPTLMEGSKTVYQLQYCADEKDCFEAAKETCPNGYRITKYGNIRPEKFVCE